MCLAALPAIPAWVGWASAAASVASTALTAVGQYQQSRSQADAYKYNARVQEMQALDAQRRGSIAEGQQHQRTKLILGAQRAAQGASGVVPDTGSSGDILEQTAEFGARDAAALRLNAEREAWGLRTQAQLDRWLAKQQQRSLPSKIAGTALTGLSNVFASNPWWKSLQQKPDTSWTGGFDSWDAGGF